MLGDLRALEGQVQASQDDHFSIFVEHQRDITTMMSNSRQRLYQIATTIPYFYTGRLMDGTQMLMGVQPPNLVGVVFDADGNYLRTSLKQLSREQRPTLRDQPEVNPKSAEDEFSAYIYGWQRELKLIAGTISVKQFSLPERWIGIRDLPEHYQEVLDHPENFSEERLRELQGDIQEWRESGEFVLDWDEDYYLSKEGELDST